MLKVVAIKDSKGSFKDQKTGSMVNYDNFNIYCIDEEKTEGILFGLCPDCYKVKKEVLYKTVKPEQVKLLENRHVEFYYDSFKKISLVQIGN